MHGILTMKFDPMADMSCHTFLLETKYSPCKTG